MKLFICTQKIQCCPIKKAFYNIKKKQINKLTILNITHQALFFNCDCTFYQIIFKSTTDIQYTTKLKFFPDHQFSHLSTRLLLSFVACFHHCLHFNFYTRLNFCCHLAFLLLVLCIPT